MSTAFISIVSSDSPLGLLVYAVSVFLATLLHDTITSGEHGGPKRLPLSRRFLDVIVRLVSMLRGYRVKRHSPTLPSETDTDELPPDL